MRCLIPALFGLMLLTSGGSSSAQIQLGDYADGSPWFLGPGGTLGFAVNGTQLTRVSDGRVFDLPAEIQADSSYQLQFRLSPSQQFLYVQKNNPSGGLSTVCGGFPNVQILMYELGATSQPIPFSSVTGPACIEGALTRQPLFFDSLGAVRSMVLVGASGSGSGTDRHQVLWADLNGRQMAVGGDTYLNGTQLIRFAPGGEAAIISHGLSAGIPFPKVTYVDLCANPLGGANSTVDLPSGLGGARVVAAGSDFQTVLLVNGNPQPGQGFSMSTSCYASPGGCCLGNGVCNDGLTAQQCLDQQGVPLSGTCAASTCLEACCLDDGSCGLVEFASCPNPQGGFSCDGVSCPVAQEACCLPNGNCQNNSALACAGVGGTPAGPGTDCFGATPTDCPSLSLLLDKAGPSQVRRGERFDYTIAYVNDGDLTVTGLQLIDTLDFGLGFVSASAGGDLFNFRDVQWAIGDLAPGASGQVSVTVQAECFAADTISNRANSLSSVPDDFGFFSNSVFTTVLDPLLTPVTMDVTSVPAGGEPVDGGDLLTHTISLTNTENETRPGLSLSMRASEGSQFEAVLDDGGGTIGMFQPTAWSWSGDLAPLQTVTFVVTTRIDTCVDADEAFIDLFDLTDPCGNAIGSATPQRFPVRRPIEVEVQADSLAPPATLETFLSRLQQQIMRRGDTVDLRFTATNPQPTSISATVTAFLPFGFDPVGDPPFLPGTAPGAVWNASARTATWSGVLAPGASADILIEALHVTDSTGSGLSMNAGDGTCTLFGFTSLAIVPELPTDPYLIGGYDREVWTYRPTIDTDPQLLYGYSSEFTGGMTRGANGDIWIWPLPLIRLNPETLELQGLPTGFLSRLGYLPDAMAVDPGDGTVLIGGSVGEGFDRAGTIRRYDPVADVLTDVFSSPGPFAEIDGIKEMVVEPSGFIGIVTFPGRLYRIDPNSGVAVDLSDTGLVTFYETIALDDQGHYAIAGAGANAPLAVVDPQDGSHTVVTVDPLVQIPTGQFPPSAVAPAAPGEWFLAYRFSGLGRIFQQPSLGGEELIPSDFFGDQTVHLAYVGPAGTCIDGDGDGVGSGSGCPGGVVDCDDANSQVFPGAVELNDGVDNQCPGEVGAGVVDEIAGISNFEMTNQFCWTMQTGATRYEVLRSADPAFGGSCARRGVDGPCWIQPLPPPPGETWYYLVRALEPFPGSFGVDSNGVERLPTCP